MPAPASSSDGSIVLTIPKMRFNLVDDDSSELDRCLEFVHCYNENSIGHESGFQDGSTVYQHENECNRGSECGAVHI
jgi:hypothetical protein